MNYKEISIKQLIDNFDSKIIGDMCYQMRCDLSNDELTPKAFFASMLNCEVKELSQIENGVSTNILLTQRYFILLRKCLVVFNTD